MHRRFVLVSGLLAAIALGSCVTRRDLVTIPEGAIVYRIEPSLIGYTFVDTTLGFDLHLAWLQDLGFNGFNCLALSPLSPTDTTGDFAFVVAGQNIGRLERLDHGTLDTINGNFLIGAEGTGGTYALTSTGELKLTWVDGIQARYFDPAAVIRLAGDTIYSDVDLKASGDSVRAQWQVRWVEQTCN